MKVTGIIRTLAGTGGVVRVQAHYDTEIEDVWGACTQPERLARWVADVEGDLHLGGDFTARFTSGWEGTGRVEVCEPPHRLVVRTRQEGESQDTQIEATLSLDGGQTLLVVEERGVSAEDLPAYGAGCRSTLRIWALSHGWRAVRHENPLERADRRLPGAGGRLMSDRIRLSGVTVNAPDAWNWPRSTPRSPAALPREMHTGPLPSHRTA